MANGDARPGRTPGDWLAKEAAFDLELLGGALGHIASHMRGRVMDDGPQGTGEPHLACAAARVLMVLERRLRASG
ncbi:MAG: hypothetical protein AAGH15_27190 [Myxococcota bacterium]